MSSDGGSQAVAGNYYRVSERGSPVLPGDSACTAGRVRRTREASSFCGLLRAYRLFRDDNLSLPSPAGNRRTHEVDAGRNLARSPPRFPGAGRRAEARNCAAGYVEHSDAGTRTWRRREDKWPEQKSVGWFQQFSFGTGALVCPG